MLLVPKSEALPQGTVCAGQGNQYRARPGRGAGDLVRKTGQTGVPVIKIESSWIVGFDKERIDRELARKAS